MKIPGQNTGMQGLSLDGIPTIEAAFQSLKILQIKARELTAELIQIVLPIYLTR